MARARNIKPALFKNEVLGVADPLFTLLFEGLWLLADREGRLEDRVLRIKAEIFPYREGLNVDQMLNWLQGSGFIQRYTVNGGSYIQINNFGKHQNPHKNEPGSEFPAPEKSEQKQQVNDIGTTSEKIGSAPADSLNLIPDSLNLIPSTDTPSQAPDSASPDDLFAKFWKRYPNKKGKTKAEQSWAKLRLTTALFDAIMDGLGRYCVSRDWLKDDGQYIPHPATWLNQRRWEDEVVPAANVHHLPNSRHSGFENRDYFDGLKQREDGTYGLA